MSNTVKNSIIYIALGFLSPALNFFLIPLYTRYLSTEQYGIITLSAIFQTVLASFIGIGVAGSYQRFYFDYEDKDQRNKLLDTCIAINIISTIAVSVFLYFFGDKLFIYFFETPEFSMHKYGWWTVITSLFGVLQLLLLSEFRNQERADTYAVFSAVFFLSGVAGVFIGVVFLQLGASGVIAGKAIGTFIPIFLYLVYLYYKRRFRIEWKMSHSLLDYGYPIMIYGLLTYFYNNSDRIIISKYFDISTLGLYGFATSIAMVTEIMVNAMNNTFKPKIYKMMKDVEDSETLKEIKLQYEYIFLIMLFILLSFVAFTAPAIKLFIGKNYHSTIIWMPLLFITYISRVYYIVFAVPIFYYKKTRIMIFVTLLTLGSTVALSLLLIPYMGIFALILVSFLANAIQVIAVILYSKRTGIYNERLYSFNRIHVQYFAFIAMVLLGYFIHFKLSGENMNYFIGYFILTWIIGLAGMASLNSKYFEGIKKIALEKLKRK